MRSSDQSSLSLQTQNVVPPAGSRLRSLFVVAALAATWVCGVRPPAARADQLADLQKCYQDVENSSEELSRAAKAGDQQALAAGVKQTEAIFEVAMRLVSTVSGDNNKAMASKCAAATQENLDYYRKFLKP